MYKECLFDRVAADMNHQTLIYTDKYVDKNNHKSASFWVRFKKNLIIETKKSMSVFSFFSIVNAVVSTLFYGFISFLFSFSFTKEIAKVIFPPLFVFLVGEYLTIIPTFFVIILMFLPIAYTGMILSFATVYSFFYVFLI